MDASLAESVLDEALGRLVRRWLAEQNADLVELAVEYGLARTREGLADLVRGRDAPNLAGWADRTESELIADWRAAWERDGLPLLSPPS